MDDKMTWYRSFCLLHSFSSISINIGSNIKRREGRGLYIPSKFYRHFKCPFHVKTSSTLSSIIQVPPFPKLINWVCLLVLHERVDSICINQRGKQIPVCNVLCLAVSDFKKANTYVFRCQFIINVCSWWTGHFNGWLIVFVISKALLW